jgi:hypothetical protein
VQALTPAVIDNRPGLSQLASRVGTHASFLATMQAALSGAAEPALQALLTRAPDDPSIAFLDCWATVADVLTFYTERIANEAYLRTATELKSVLELARLTGCRLRPGLAASAYLAYTLQVNPAKVTSVLIAQGSQAMSVPGPGQQPQAFETSADLYAQQTWNTLPVRTTTPAIVTAQQLESSTMVSLQGASLAISAGNRVVLSGGGAPLPMSVKTVSADATAAVTTLSLLPDSSAVGSASDAAASAPAVARPEVKNGGQLLNLAGLIGPLQVPHTWPGRWRACSGPGRTWPRNCWPASPPGSGPASTRRGDGPRARRLTTRCPIWPSSGSRRAFSARRRRASRCRTRPVWWWEPRNGRCPGVSPPGSMSRPTWPTRKPCRRRSPCRSTTGGRAARPSPPIRPRRGQ